jgi:hypothetical protein
MLERTGDQVHGTRKIAPLQGDHPEIMEHLGLVGPGFEDFPVKLLSLSESACLMVLQR